MYNYNHLYYFYIAAKFKSITKASNFLNISQPSLSFQIKTLEEKLSLELFKRNGRNVELTHKGESFFNICSEMFQHENSLTNLLQLKESSNDQIIIGVSNQIERPFIAEIIGKLIHQTSPDKRQKIKMLNMERNINNLEMFDLIISHKKESLKSHQIINLNLPVALVGLSSKLKKNGNNFRNLNTFLKNYDDGFVIPSDEFNLRKEIEYYLSKENIKLKINFESDNMAANLRAISEGIGIGFFPLIYAHKEIKLKKLEYFMPTNGIWSHNIFLHYPKQSIELESITKLIDLFIDAGNNNL